MSAAKEASRKINRYLAIKTMTSLATGIIVAIVLGIMGVDFPMLWGLLAFLLNFIPTIGSIIAAVPPVLLAMVQFNQGMAVGVAVLYTAVNMIIGNFLEPRFMGKGLGLSPLVVFLSLLFWGWLLGTIGMFLSVPLTMTVKIICDTRDDTKWVGVLLGP
jgi:predicted PurR-regulated permease PerM